MAIGRRMLMMKLSGKRKRFRPKRRLMDAVRGDIAVAEATDEDAADRENGDGSPIWRLLTGEAERGRRRGCVRSRPHTKISILRFFYLLNR